MAAGTSQIPSVDVFDPVTQRAQQILWYEDRRYTSMERDQFGMALIEIRNYLRETLAKSVDYVEIFRRIATRGDLGRFQALEVFCQKLIPLFEEEGDEYLPDILSDGLGAVYEAAYHGHEALTRYLQIKIIAAEFKNEMNYLITDGVLQGNQLDLLIKLAADPELEEFFVLSSSEVETMILNYQNPMLEHILGSSSFTESEYDRFLELARQARNTEAHDIIQRLR